MTESLDSWATRLKDLNPDADDEKARKFVRELYQAAQKDLDAQRAQAEAEREE
ncbi:hypothetical protein ACWCP6_23930 [Streptomyces sp. NPDC002004]